MGEEHSTLGVPTPPLRPRIADSLDAPKQCTGAVKLLITNNTTR